MKARRREAGDAEFTPAIDRRIIEGFLADREAMLDELEAKGFTRAAVLRRVRTLGFTKERVEQHRVNPHRLSLRTCIGCEHDFLSEGPHNRFCDRCRPRETT